MAKYKVLELDGNCLKIDLGRYKDCVDLSPLASNISANWGSIGGTLSAQTDLQTALNAKANTSALSGYLPITGGLLTGNLTVNSDFNGAGDSQISLRGKTITSKVLKMGFNTASNIGYIQSVQEGIAGMPLWLNPQGGNVLIKGTVDTGEALQVNGAAKISTVGSSGGVTLRLESPTTSDAGLTIANTTSNSQIFINGSLLKIGKAGVADFLSIHTGTGNVLIGTTTDIPNSILTLTSTTKGFRPPKMTTTQKNAITSPDEGLMVYDLTLHKLCVYTASAWETITSA